jgi:hypothetical protein
MSQPNAENRILNWVGPIDIKKTLAGLVADNFLWKRPSFNEHELLKHLFDPFMKAFLCSADMSVGSWYV